MACKTQGVQFNGTREQEIALKEVIALLRDTKGSLMPIMQKAQEIYGYLPIEVQTMISDETGIPLEKIYGVAPVRASAQGKVPDICLSWNCMLCKGFWRHLP